MCAMAWVCAFASHTPFLLVPVSVVVVPVVVVASAAAEASPPTAQTPASLATSTRPPPIATYRVVDAPLEAVPLEPAPLGPPPLEPVPPEPKPATVRPQPTEPAPIRRRLNTKTQDGDLKRVFEMAKSTRLTWSPTFTRFPDYSDELLSSPALRTVQGDIAAFLNDDLQNRGGRAMQIWPQLIAQSYPELKADDLHTSLLRIVARCLRTRIESSTGGLYDFIEYCSGGELFDRITAKDHYSEREARVAHAYLRPATGAQP